MRIRTALVEHKECADPGCPHQTAKGPSLYEGEACWCGLPYDPATTRCVDIDQIIFVAEDPESYIQVRRVRCTVCKNLFDYPSRRDLESVCKCKCGEIYATKQHFSKLWKGLFFDDILKRIRRVVKHRQSRPACAACGARIQPVNVAFCPICRSNGSPAGKQGYCCLAQNPSHVWMPAKNTIDVGMGAHMETGQAVFQKTDQEDSGDQSAHVEIVDMSHLRMFKEVDQHLQSEQGSGEV